MNKTRRTTANLPVTLLDEARKITKKGITETLIEGLHLIRRTLAYEKAQALKGKIKIQVDIDESRERCRR